MISLLRTLFLTAAVRTGAGEAKRTVQRGLARAAIVALGGLLAFCGLAFFVIAGHDALADWLNPQSAKLICGAVLVALGAILFALGRRSGRRRIRVAEPSAPEAVGDAAAAIGHDIEAVLSRHAGALTIGAFVLGLLLATRRK
jgi:protein-S-isoprenylcysteine O-methyltransferase Ste14